MTYNIKTGKENTKDMDYNNRHGGLGHEVQESWPYLSNATPWPYELSHVKNEFSLVGLTACIHVKSTIFKFRAPPLPLSPALIGFFFFFQVIF